MGVLPFRPGAKLTKSPRRRRMEAPSPNIGLRRAYPRRVAWQALGIRAWRKAKLWIALSKGRNDEREYQTCIE
jgi:hypothetical protein